MSEESAGDMYDRLGVDGLLWAQEMSKRFSLEVGELLPWTCSMIMAGYDKGAGTGVTRLPDGSAFFVAEV